MKNHCNLFTIFHLPKAIDLVYNYSTLKRNKFESVEMRWMNLEPIIQSEVNQKEKNKC